MEGWIKLHRAITTKDIYLKDPLYLRVFERLILEANHVCRRIPYNRTTRLVRRGERITSIRQIAEWVSWYERGIQRVPNPKTISEILKWLVDNELIEIYKISNKQETHYNIVNYNTYQAVEVNESNSKVTVNGVASKQQTDTNKNKKNVKNVKDDIYSSEFEDFFSIYPNPFNKPQSYKNWCSLLKKGVLAKTIMVATNNYIQYLQNNKVDPKYYVRSTNFIGQKQEYVGYVECPSINGEGYKPKRVSKFDVFIKDEVIR